MKCDATRYNNTDRLLLLEQKTFASALDFHIPFHQIVRVKRSWFENQDYGSMALLTVTQRGQ